PSRGSIATEESQRDYLKRNRTRISGFLSSLLKSEMGRKLSGESKEGDGDDLGRRALCRWRGGFGDGRYGRRRRMGAGWTMTKGLLVSEKARKYVNVKELDDPVKLKDGTIVLQFVTLTEVGLHKQMG
ncbi:hypothetical protein U1Q18_048813, partial [Sarracenia purpurea var. burkii]